MVLTVRRRGRDGFGIASQDQRTEEAMGTFAEHNFGNDGALDYLSMLTAKLVATITEVLGDESRRALDEDGETLLMPSVEILALLCERYGAVPPKPATVQHWTETYLDVYDREIDRLRPKSGFKAARRKVIDNTFRWLGSLSESHWARD
jgi:hypothetical protein